MMKIHSIVKKLRFFSSSSKLKQVWLALTHSSVLVVLVSSRQFSSVLVVLVVLVSSRYSFISLKSVIIVNLRNLNQ